eukprot:gene65760-89983_t
MKKNTTKPTRRNVGLAALALAAAALVPATASAQQQQPQQAFPTKPVRIITPFPVGG